MKKLLVVDDEPGLLFLIQEELENSFEVFCCQNPQEALEKQSTFQPNIVLTDLNLGTAINGEELSRRIKQNAPKTIVVIMTGEISFKQKKSSLADAIIPKNISFINHLSQTLANMTPS